jgi:hypothetical protein
MAGTTEALVNLLVLPSPLQQVNDGPVTFLLDSADPNNQLNLGGGASTGSLSSADV